MDLKKAENKASEVVSFKSSFVPRCVLLLVSESIIPLGGVRSFIVLSDRSNMYRLLNYRNYNRNSELYGSIYIYIFIERYIEGFGTISNNTLCT